MQLKQLKKLIGSPIYEDEDVLLYNGDSLKIMEKIPSESISLTVTSPPYNIGKEYESVLEIDNYISWTKEWTNTVHRITSNNGAFWLNLGYMSIPDRAKAMPIPYLLWDHIQFFLIQEVVWNYSAGVAGRLFFSPRNEKFLWYVKNKDSYIFNLDDVRDPNVKYPNQKKNGKLKCNPNGKNPTDVWQIAKVTSGTNRSSKERTAHPTQFPLELINRIILTSSNKDDVVLDPFAGSGSSLEAAIRNDRKVIGIEIERRYVDIAIQRIKNVRKDISGQQAQSSIFDLNRTLDSYKLQTC